MLPLPSHTTAREQSLPHPAGDRKSVLCKNSGTPGRGGCWTGTGAGVGQDTGSHTGEGAGVGQDTGSHTGEGARVGQDTGVTHTGRVLEWDRTWGLHIGEGAGLGQDNYQSSLLPLRSRISSSQSCSASI